MQYEEPILVDLEDLEAISGGSCNTGGSGNCTGDGPGSGNELPDIEII